MTDAQIKVVRPTEAQLRWAAFRFKHQAVQVREAIDQLWQTPADVKAVEGAFSEDGITTEESSCADDVPRRPKPKISRGRRALLRVSKRKFEKRRVEIERSGFVGDRTDGGIGNNDDDTLEALFADESIQKRRRRRRKNHKGGKEADRVRRFEAAFHSMMKNFEASQEPKYVIETPSKIWTRPEGADNLESLDYSALKLGSHQKINNPRLRLSDLPADKGASWLVHLPERSSNLKQHPSHTKGNYNRPSAQEGFSPVRQRFRKIVTEFQCVKSPQPNPGADAPTKNVTKYFVPTDGENNESMQQTDDFPQTPSQSSVMSKAAAFERRNQTEEQLEAVFRSMDPELLKEMEQLDPGVSDRLRALYLGEDSPRLPVKEIAQMLEQKTPISANNGFVSQFVDSIENAMQARQEELVAADGKLQKAAFANLVNQYLVETGNRSKLGNHDISAANEGKVSAIAESFLSKISEANETDDPFGIINSAGSFDKSAFRDLVTRYLSEASGVDEHIVERAEDLESLANQSSAANENNVGHVVVISRQLASDLIAQIEVERQNPTSSNEKFVGRTVKEFFVSNCGVNREEFNGGDVALTNAVSSLEDDIHRFLSYSPEQEADPEELENHLCSHFVDFFEGSMNQEREGAEHSEKSDVKIIPKAFVADLVQKIHQMSNVEKVVSDDGLLDVSKVSSLIKRYLAATTASPNATHESFLQQAQSPLALAQVRRAAGTRPSRHSTGDESRQPALPFSMDEETSNKFLQIYIDNLKSNANNQALRRRDGTVDEGKLAQLLEESSEVAQKCVNEDYLSANKALPMRREKPAAPSVVSELTYVPGDEKKLEDNQKVGKLVNSMKQKFGGFVRRLYSTEDGETDSEVKVYSAFRKSHEGQRDDTSSHTSFFPEGIRSAVQKLGGNAPVERKTLDHEGQPHEEDLRGDTLQGSAMKLDSELPSTNGKYLSNVIGNDIIDTDGSDVGDAAMHHERLKNLTLSPAILAKRHRQAIRCIEKRQWKEIQYLLNANPWLAEMSDANTRQYLLHKLALYGAGKGVLNDHSAYVIKDAAPLQVNTNLVRLFPSSVHKFDQEGNLPLHMAAASANVSMAQLLGDRFPSGATVRNEDGLLPVHLAILACASPLTSGYGNADNAREMVQTILGYFSGAIAVTDNDGNLPIHTAATVLRGEVGVDVIFMLYDEARRQLKDPFGARFKNKLKLEDLENMSMGTQDTATPTVSSNNFDECLQCTLVKNDLGWTPLFCAIHSCAKWEVIDALVQGPHGDKAALETDEDGNNALHLLLDERYLDPTSALSVLKAAPESACARNIDGMLPIELACMHGLHFELIMAIVLSDLPIEIDNKDSPKQRDGFGASWWFIACDTDDHYIEIVDEVVSMCSVEQIRELAYMKNPAGDTLVSMAAPECKEILQSSLRYIGRFEVKEEVAIADSLASGITVFEAVDYGYTEDGLEDGIDVYLKFFSDKATYETETNIIRDLDLEFSLVEEVFAFDIEDMEDDTFDESRKFCLCIEKPRLTLASVVSGMLRNEDCQKDPRIRSYYNAKALAVLRAVAKALLHLHTIGVVHGNLSPSNVGKYDTIWKIAGMSGVQKIGEVFESHQFHSTVPPEALYLEAAFGPSSQQVKFRTDLHLSSPIDVWGFGQLAYEVLVGQPLVRLDEIERDTDKQMAMADIAQWNDFNVEVVRQDLDVVGVAEAAAELICDCLHPEPSKRPTANGILAHKIWHQLRRRSEEPNQRGPDEQEI